MDAPCPLGSRLAQEEGIAPEEKPDTMVSLVVMIRTKAQAAWWKDLFIVCFWRSHHSWFNLHFSDSILQCLPRKTILLDCTFDMSTFKKKNRFET